MPLATARKKRYDDGGEECVSHHAFSPLWGTQTPSFPAWLQFRGRPRQAGAEVGTNRLGSAARGTEEDIDRAARGVRRINLLRKHGRSRSASFHRSGVDRPRSSTRAYPTADRRTPFP